MPRRIGVVLSIVLGFLARTDVGLALPLATWACFDDSISYHFDSAWNNYPNAKQSVREGIDTWKSPLDHDGNKLVSLVEVPDGFGEVSVEIYDSETSNGEAECWLGASILIDIDIITDGPTKLMRRVARQEMGHLFGLVHSGKQDSFSGVGPPTMSTCLYAEDVLALPPENGLSGDDVAALNFWHSSINEYSMTANIGFENGLIHWANAGSGSLESQYSGGQTGPRRVRHLTPAVDSGYVYQTVRVSSGDDYSKFRSRLAYKVGSSGYSGRVRGVLYSREISYPNPWNGCNYEDGLLDLNYPQDVGLFVEIADTGEMSIGGATTWQNAASAYVSRLESGRWFQFRVHTFARDSLGTPQWVLLDNHRVEGQPS